MFYSPKYKLLRVLHVQCRIYVKKLPTSQKNGLDELDEYLQAYSKQEC